MTDNPFAFYEEQLNNLKNKLIEANCEKLEIIEKSFLVKGIMVKSLDYYHAVGLVLRTDRTIDKIISLKQDKDGLYNWNDLKERIPNVFGVGYFSYENYYLMVSHFFRRGYDQLNNFTPSFIDEFYKLDKNHMHASLSLDDDAIRIDEPRPYFEADAWFGALFQNKISLIEDGIIKCRPPIHQKPNFVRRLYNNNYSLDMKWSTKGNIKTFQLSEFKDESVTIAVEGQIRHPVRYIHAEYNLDTNSFQHFDGAIHFYNKNHYLEKRDSDLNYESKYGANFKAKSKKLFRLDGVITVEQWSNLTTHFLHGNPLIIEYFTGDYPQYVKKILNI
ncbi:hypothetical protein [Acinetobacter tibetensis]|uniref:Uncharacterized protein n=2 Tax=Acinetobacter tibetensis TaxID=2943497 RepID=A0AAE9LUK5_9GAMM|nr:hypothetical protein [Acinetobacter tibetensis]USE84571.1 hypothetical protein M5E07_07210 [Acinetobacter tibetensis]